jgi:DNA-binding Lrp family transcriptional regulator
MNLIAPEAAIDEVDRHIIKATQEGLPLCSRPYHAVAESLGLDPDEVMARMRRMLATGVIRRIGVVPNHYRLGFGANGMSVWDIPDHAVSKAGAAIGELAYVSHCYARPLHPPVWPYNLFAMVHGRNRDEVSEKIDAIAGLLGDRVRGWDVLYSTRILKKAGLRLVD